MWGIGMNHMSFDVRGVARGLPAIALAGLLAACGGGGAPEPASLGGTYPPAFPTETLIGSWGVASYREDKDRERVEAIARDQCKQPYVITKGPSDGVMMHAADDPVAKELKLKGSADGMTYLGFEAPPGHWQDRLIVSYAPDFSVITMQFVNPEIATRYGTFIYVRCST
jgi:hypothetical protein